jgi:hypothetical protein
LFVDGGVADYQQLVAGATPGTEIHVLDPVQDAVTQITQALLGREGISSLHIVSHGESGGLDFGSSRLNLTDLPGYAAQVQSWGQALTDDADILLYGCNVAQGEVGKAFVQILGQLTGADVAASDDLTGSSVLGGDWTLEYQTGRIEAGLGFAPTAMGGYGKVLDATFAAVQQFGNSGSSVTTEKVVTDSSGNVYTTGYFQGTVDFDPGAATANLTSAGSSDIFVSKLDSSGNYVWAKRMGSTTNDLANGISVDSSGNVYTTGYFQGTADFDPGAATANLTSAGSADIFVSKLDSSGNYVWAKRMGTTTNDLAYGISVDSSGNVYTTGYFQGTVDFDPGAATANLTSAGSADIFVSKLDSSGNYVWAKRMGGTSTDIAYGISVDSSGNVYTTGYFQGTADFDPGAATANLTSAGSADIFVSKLDSSGNYVWAKRMGGTSSDIANGISVDSSGNVYTTGYFQGTADFDPGAATANLTSAVELADIFVSKLDSSGNYVWAKGMGGTSSDIAYGISVDSSGNVYTTGYFQGTVDFDPGAATANLTSAGSADIFVSKLDSSGNYVWAKGMGGTSSDIAYGISVDSSDNVYTTGYFQGTADFDPGAGVVNRTSVGSPDGFLSKLSQNRAPTVTVAAAALSYTENDPATLIDTTASVSDSDSLNFDTGTLTVSYTAGGTVDDRLAIQNQGTAAGQIGVSGSTVSFGGVAIGTFTGGTGITPLVVTFNPASSPAAAQALLRNLTYRNVSDTPTAARAVQFILTDGDGGTSTAVTKTINVTVVNDAPTIAAPSSVTVIEDIATAITGISFADLDAGAASVTATFTVATGTLAATAGGGVTVGGSASALTLTGNLTNLNAFIAASNLEYTTLANSNTGVTLGVTLNDNGNSPGAALSATTDVAIAVTPVNDQPNFTAVNPATSPEDTGLQTVTNWASFNPGNPVESAQTATYSVSALSNPSLFAVPPSIAPNGTLTYQAAANANGSSTFSVTVTDNGGTTNGGVNTSNTQIFTITVSPVNDRPSFTALNPVTILEDAGLQTLTNWATFNPGAPNEVGQTATYSVSNISNPTLFAVAPSVANGTLTYRAAADANGTATFDLLVTDDGGTANSGINTSVLQTFTITITSVNDAPSFTPGANQTVAAGAGAQTVADWITSFSPGPANEDSQTALGYTVVGNTNPGLFSVQPTIAANGTLTYTPATSLTTPGTATLTLQVQDNGGIANSGVDTSTTQTFTITVNPQTVSLNALDATAAESGGNTGLYRVSRTATGGSQIIQLAIAGASTATLTNDYSLSLSAASTAAGATLSIVGTTLTVVLPDGVADADLILTAVDDIQAEAAETVTLNLLVGSTYALSAADTGTVSITQNDFVVINTNDSGEGSLRQAILNANAIAGDDTISFANLFTDATPDTITLTSGEFGINSNLTLVGTGANLLTLSGNNASRVFNISSGIVGMDGVTIANGNSGGAGGGISNNGTLTLTNSTVRNNTSLAGGGIANYGTLTTNNSTISGNAATNFEGGGIANYGTLTASNTTFSSNAGSYGGGIYNFFSSTVALTNSTISGNAATNFEGGGILNYGTLTAVNTTITANSANTQGGGIVNNDTATITNTLIAGNTNAASPDLQGNFTGSNNLIGKSDGSSGLTNGVNGNIVGTIAAPINPLLAPLASNGGSTQTHALLPGSAALNAGTSTGVPATDQRGIARVGAVDIGAYESRGFTITPTSGTPQSAVRNTAFGNPLVATVSSAFGEQVNGGVITFTAPGTGASTTVPTQTATIASGVASVTETANNTVGTYSIIASANGIATPANFSLTNTNTRPVVTNVSKGGTEDTTVSFASADFTDQFTDGNGDSLTRIQITALPTKGLLQLGSVNVTLNQEITAAQLSTLTYIPNPDSNGLDSFSWNGSDGLDYATTGATVNLNIAAINDAPLLSLPATVTVSEDAGAQTIANFATLRPGPATATDEAGQTLTVTPTVTGTTGTLTFTSAPAIDASGNLTFQTAANTFGTATISVIVTDSGSNTAPNSNTSTTQTFTITVNSVNDQPIFTAVNPPTVNEDAGLQTVTNWATFNPGPADEAAQTATYTISNLSNPSLFSTAPTVAPNGTLTYNLAANVSGTTTFDVIVQDNGGTANGGIDTSATQTFTLTVNPVNDQPTFTAINPPTVSEDAGAQTVANWATFNPGPADEATQTATYTVSSISNPSLFTTVPTIAPDGSLSYTLATNVSGTTTFNVSVQDSGSTTNGGLATSTTQSFTLTVNSTNDQPTFTATNPATVNEDAGAQTLANWATFTPGPADEAAQTATYTVSNLSNPSLFTVAPTIAPNGTLTYTAAPNAFGTATFDVVVQDNGGTGNGGVDTSTTQTFTLTVNSVNDAPSVTPGANQSLAAGAGAQTVTNFASFNPGAANESGQAATYTIVNNSNPGLFSVAPMIAPDGTLTYTPVGTLTNTQTATLTLQVQDNGGRANGGVDTSTPQTFTITVNPGTVPTTSRGVEHDFNGDGRADLLVRQPTLTSTNQSPATARNPNNAYSLQFSTPAGFTAVDITTLGPNFEVVATGDFNGDGKADLLWRNKDNNAYSTWLLDGSTYIGGGIITALPANFEVVATGDFNGDGKADLLWRNQDNNAYSTWLMDGNTYIGGGIITALPANFAVAKVADFNGDGKADLLWRNQDNNAYSTWLLDGNTYIGGGTVATVPFNFQVVATGDFNGDGKADLLWKNSTTNSYSNWFLSGNTYIGGGSIATLASHFELVAVGDYNGDGNTDLCWRNGDNGVVDTWWLDGFTYIGGQTVGTLPLNQTVLG